jgi:hypothetical protein
MASPCFTQAELTRYVRRELGSHFYDDSAASPEGTAIYWLADPRDIQLVRYVGQTRAPRRRFLQHLNTARLWLPEEKPWWVQSPRLRPLYDWIRDLYQDDGRLPVMVICAWVDTTARARVVERTRIMACLEQRLPLLNFESELLARQMLLI